VGDLEHGPLGTLDEVARRAVLLEDRALDLVRGRQQPAQQRVLADDLRVAAARCPPAGTRPARPSIVAGPPIASSFPASAAARRR
jgi:hypothetical protein